MCACVFVCVRVIKYYGCLQTVVPGMLLLGAVLEVNKLHAVFSLPFNLRGVVAISDVSDHVTKLVRAEAQGSDDMVKE